MYTGVNGARRFLAGGSFGRSKLLQRGLEMKQLFIEGLMGLELI
jgi:hypothetical protein